MFRLILTLCLLSSVQPQASESEIDYYENLINEGISNSNTYQFPRDASEYKTINEDVPIFYGTFDFIIVGAGSAGSVIASRLSEVKRWNVLLLEAGNEETNFTQIPSMMIHVAFSEYNWGYHSTRQDTCCLSIGGVCPFFRGRGVGGTSAMNGLLYSRGNRADYDKWASLGNPGWSYKDVLPFFIKSENAHIGGDEGYRGRSGYLSVEYHRPQHSKSTTFLNASNEIGQPVIEDYNGRRQLGASVVQYNTIRGRRDSAAKAFLTPARKRRNLKILTRAFATKISLQSKKVRGVQFSHNNVKYYAKAKREVILSAGTLGSAKLLLLSGVGPKKQLQQHKIPLAMDLAVGERLRDHTSYFNMLILTSVEDEQVTLRESIRQYLDNGNGPLTYGNGDEVIEYFHLSLTNSTSPDIEYLISPSTNTNGGYGQVIPKLLPRLYVDPLGQVPMNTTNIKGRLSTLVVILQHPKSVGRIYLNSSDPYEYPIIQSTCLGDPNNEDVETLYQGIQYVFKLLNTTSLREIQARLLTYLPCSQHPVTSKEYWMCNFRMSSSNSFHPIATCGMGPNPKKGAVVDNRLRVHGFKNLRVADCSVVPITLAAHMSGPAMMIGEKVSDIIKKEYNIFD